MLPISAVHRGQVLDHPAFNPKELSVDRLAAVDSGKNEVAIETLEVAAVVTDNKDPDRFARAAAPRWQWLPEVDDQVLVAFGRGDSRRSPVLGALWSAADAPPPSSR